MPENTETTAKVPIKGHWEMLSGEWAPAAVDALLDMVKDIVDGMAEGDIDQRKLEDDTLENDFAFLRHLMGRREVIVNEIRLARGGHRRGAREHVD